MMNLEVFTIPESKKHKEESGFCLEKLKELCREKYGYEVVEDKILKNDHGKPYFADNANLHFNISHSKGLGVIVFDDKPCGVDVELITNKRYDVSKRFFSEEEKEWVLESACDEQKVERMLKIWTAKEAYTKMLGVGLTVDLREFNVLEEPIKSKLEYIIKDNYIICVCREL